MESGEKDCRIGLNSRKEGIKKRNCHFFKIKILIDEIAKWKGRMIMRCVGSAEEVKVRERENENEMKLRTKGGSRKEGKACKQQCWNM